MRKRFIPALVALMLLIGLASAPAEADGGRVRGQASAAMHFPPDYCDGTLNWNGWQWPSDGSTWGAYNLCGRPNHGHFKVGAWDGSSDGYCIEIWRAQELTNSVWYAVPGTRACGADIVRISAWQYDITRRLMAVKSTTAGNWVSTVQFYYQF